MIGKDLRRLQRPFFSAVMDTVRPNNLFPTKEGDARDVPEAFVRKPPFRVFLPAFCFTVLHEIEKHGRPAFQNDRSAASGQGQQSLSKR
jgi:hypothetical protein